MEDVQLTNGEPSNWTRFYSRGCTAVLVDDKTALAARKILNVDKAGRKNLYESMGRPPDKSVE